MSAFDLSRIRSVEDADVKDKRVLLRADLNVPMREGVVGDTTRIERILPTVRLLREKGAKVIVLSHWGRPKGTASQETSLRPIAEAMAKLVPDAKVSFAADCVGETAAEAVDALEPGDVLLLENLRHHIGEEKNDADFARELAKLGDIYVNDAFSSAHRAHASTAAIAQLLPAYAGLLMIAEIRALEQALENPRRPVMAIVGGSKVSTKIAVLDNLAKKVDVIVVAGGMANTFLFADGLNVGKSLCEKDAVTTVKQIEAHAKDAACEIVLPQDAVTAKALEPGVETETCSISAVAGDSMILDVGPETVADLKRRLSEVNTLLWNGPLGAFETAPFDAGTMAIAKEAARLTEAGDLVSVGGGGDTVAALKAAGVADKFTYVSTAGGAFLEWLEGKELPAVAALASGATKKASELAATDS
ncbi:phosphoglycerate kinase [Methyloligella sp. 2.7D]|uniref:phosphoglycerate kinase n=1 Tax=unclassified Methyloligella TaxID=2625955 RepID=UPI00157D45F2|nr:phosphoglycerate kinase [Methyloligella sp. GL2]QKP77897.1 phosphoglycerate kinase [Methyloligella sp. GL2]